MFFLFPPFQSGYNLLPAQTQSYLSDDKIILQNDSLSEKIFVDTTLHFQSIKEIAIYKHNKDSLFITLILHNNRISAEIKDKIEIDNSIRFSKLMYKFLVLCNKNIPENFNFLGLIIKDSEVFSRGQLLNLFYSFPEEFRKTDRGKNYLIAINMSQVDIGHSFFNSGEVSLESAGGTLMPLRKLIDGNHQFYVVIFTASWCAPCRYYANVFRNDLDKLNRNEVKIFSISIDKSRDQWLQYLQAERYNWSNFRLLKGWESELAKYLHVDAIPRYFLLDHGGIIIDEHSGYGMEKIINKIKGTTRK